MTAMENIKFSRPKATDEEVKAASEKLFGTYLKTIQTGDEGKLIEKLYICLLYTSPSPRDS